MPGMGSGSGMMPGMGGGMMPGMGGGMMPGEYGMDDGAGGMAATGPKDPLVELFRRQLKYEIKCVRDGMNGVGRLVAVEKGKTPFAELTADIDLVWKATNPPAGGSSIPYLYKSLKDNLKGLESKTAALLPKPKAAVDESTELASDIPGDVPPAAAVGAQPPGGIAPAGSAAVGVNAPGKGANPGAVPPVNPAARNPGAAPAGPDAAADSDIPPGAAAPVNPAPAGVPPAAGAPAAGGVAPQKGAAGAAPGNPAAPLPDVPPGT